MTKERVQRMLALARQKRQAPLGEADQQELDALRQEYLRDFREGFRQQLDSVYLEQEDGSYQKLRRKDLPEPEGD